MRKKYLLIVFSLFLFLIAGSGQALHQVGRYVVRAEVVFSQPGQQIALYYHQPEKLSSLLTCLRLARTKGPAKLPPAGENDHSYRITLFYSDRTSRVFQLQNYRYLSSDGKTWQKVPEAKAQLLYLLVHLLPGD